MKRLLIPGAGIYQVPLIKKARDMGIYTIVASTPGSWPGFSIADKVCEVDTTDCEGMLKAAETERIDGIVTTGTDVAVHSIGLICDRLGLPGISAEAALCLTDKAAMKEAFRGVVSTSPFHRVSSLREAEEAASDLGYPLMVKAVDVSGSRGVTRVDRPEDLADAVGEALHASHRPYFIVERVAAGTEMGLDVFVEGGEIRAFCPHRKFVWQRGGRTIPAGHAFPFEGSPALMRNLEKEMRGIIRATGLDNCAVNCDIMTDGDKVSVIEAGGRCGATCIPELITAWSGIDYYRQMILCAIGEPTDFTPLREQPCMAKLLLSEASGYVASIDMGRIEGLKEKTGADICLDVRPGDQVHSARNGTDRFGHVILNTSDEDELDELVDCVKGAVRLAAI